MTDPTSRTVVTTRLLKHPRERVWGAFSDAKTLEGWWGPDGFTSAFKIFEFKPGGRWNMTMAGPDGATFENAMVFDEVKAPESIVYTYVDPQHEFRMEMTFEASGAETRLTWRMTFARQDEYDKVSAFVAPANEQNFDKLERMLASSR